MFEEDRVQTVIANGVKLEVVATKASENEWELAIVNPLGIWSVWLERYSTAQQALDAGLKAIDDEGAGSFMDIEGFDYLLDQ